MRKSLLYIVAIIILVIVLAILVPKRIRCSNLNKAIEVGDFEITYTYSPSMKEYKTKIVTLRNETNARIEYQNYQDTIEEYTGIVNLNDIQRFLYYAIIKKDFFNINDIDENKNIVDGYDVFLKIRLGSKEKEIGGYMPKDKRFNNIKSSLERLFPERVQLKRVN